MGVKVKREGIYSKSRKSPHHAHIDPNARGTLYVILHVYGIYTAVPPRDYHFTRLVFLAFAFTKTPFSK